jgi:hypothetical protein
MPESPSQDNRTNHRSRHGEHLMLCSKLKNDPSKGQIGRGQHPKWRKTIMHGTILGLLRALFCVPGGIYRPEFSKLNLTPDCQALSRTMTGAWESLSLRIGYAKAVLVGVPDIQIHAHACSFINAPSNCAKIQIYRQNTSKYTHIHAHTCT